MPTHIEITTILEQRHNMGLSNITEYSLESGKMRTAHHSFASSEAAV